MTINIRSILFFVTVFDKNLHDVIILKSIFRFSQMLRCSEGCFTLAGVYLKRFLQKRPDVKVDALNAHRLALVSLVVAAKYNDDTYFTNSYYSYCGGKSSS